MTQIPASLGSSKTFLLDIATNFRSAPRPLRYRYRYRYRRRQSALDLYRRAPRTRRERSKGSIGAWKVDSSGKPSNSGIACQRFDRTINPVTVSISSMLLITKIGLTPCDCAAA